MYDSVLVQSRKPNQRRRAWDSNRWYSDHVWAIPPISAEDERRTARGILDAEQATLALTLQDRRVLKELIVMVQRFLRGKLRARELFETEKDRDKLMAKAKKLRRRLVRMYQRSPELEEQAKKSSDAEARLDSLRATLADQVWSMPVNRRLIRRLADKVGGRKIERLAGRIRKMKQRIVQPHLRLVLSISRRYTGRGLPYMDLIQEGNAGLLLAVDKFDHRHGFRFSTYAGWWIRQCIIRALAHQSRIIRVPVNLNTQIIRLERDRAALARELDRSPTTEELAKRVKLSADKVRDLLSHRKTVVSMETPLDGDGNLRLGDIIQDPDCELPTDIIGAADARRETKKALASLSEREREVVRRRFGLDGLETETLAEIGREMGISRERVRQIQERALQRLRHPSRGRLLAALR